MAKDKSKNAVEITMTKARDTKGTYVYKNDEQGAAIPSLYIKKSAIDGEAPEKIVVTVNAA